jgi:hypothetical protein
MFSDLKKISHPWKVAGLAGALLALAPASAHAQPSHPSFDGVWQVDPAYALTADDSMIRPDGKPIPFQPWNEALFNGAAASENREHFPWPPNNQRCLIAGTVRAMKGNFPWRLIEAEDQITLLFEEDGRVNIIPFKDPGADKSQSSWYGSPIARWEGDTLVVEARGFNGKTPFPHAIMHTTALHLVHHFRLIDNGAKLEDRLDIEDPGAFTKPWTSIIIFNRQPDGYKLRDYRCAENNRDLPQTDGPMTFWGADWGPN